VTEGDKAAPHGEHRLQHSILSTERGFGENPQEWEQFGQFVHLSLLLKAPPAGHSEPRTRDSFPQHGLPPLDFRGFENGAESA